MKKWRQLFSSGRSVNPITMAAAKSHDEMVVTVVTGALEEGQPKTVHFTEGDLNELAIPAEDLETWNDKKKKDLARAMTSGICTSSLGSIKYNDPSEWNGQSRRARCMKRFLIFLDRILSAWSGNPSAQQLFPSSQSIKLEKQRQKEINRFIIHPYSIFRIIWDLLMVLVLFVTMLVLPVEVAFYADDLWDVNWKAFNLCVDFAFLTDILVNLRTGYIKDDGSVLNNKPIIKNYMTSWFILDFVSSVPFDYLVLTITDGTVVLASTLRALRMVKFVSLLRLFRFVRLVRYLDKINDFWHVDAKILSIFKLIYLILVFAHWNACIQYMVANIQGFPSYSWVIVANLQHENVTVWSRYTHALYRGMSHMISIGYGMTAPNGDAETWMVIMSMMTGASFYALFIAHMSGIVMSLDTSGRRFNEKVCEVRDYMRYRRMPAALQRRVLNYYDCKYQQKYFDEQNIVNERHMSYPLRKEILMHNCRSLVESVPFLASAPSEFLVDVILKLVMHLYFPGEEIVQAGKKGDAMYFIEHGAVNIKLPSGEIVNTLRDGTHFGEVSLLFLEKRIADVIAVEPCYIYRLSKVDFEDVLDEYPRMREVMLEVARTRMRETQMKLGFDPDRYREKIRPVHMVDNSQSTLGQPSMTMSTSPPSNPDASHQEDSENANNNSNTALSVEPHPEEEQGPAKTGFNNSNANDVFQEAVEGVTVAKDGPGAGIGRLRAEEDGGVILRREMVDDEEPAGPQHSQSDISVDGVRRRHHVCKDSSLPDVSI